MVGILDHLAATHRAQISEAVRAMVIDSVGGGAGDEECEAAASEGKKKKEAEKEKDPTAQQVATVPYLLFLAQRSDSFRAVEKWKTDLDSKVLLPDGRPIPCVLLGNKSDVDASLHASH